jgi:hypothetical protein
VVVAVSAATRICARAREQLGERERLHQIVDGARVQAGDAILDLTTSGEDDHRQLRLEIAQFGEHLHAADPGEHQIEHNYVKALAQRSSLALDAVECRLDGEPLGLEPSLQEVDDPRLVLHQQDRRRQRWVRCRLGQIGHRIRIVPPRPDSSISPRAGLGALGSGVPLDIPRVSMIFSSFCYRTLRNESHTALNESQPGRCELSHRASPADLVCGCRTPLLSQRDTRRE